MKNGHLPTVELKGDWIDVYSAEEVRYIPGNEFRLRLGFAMKLPPGYEAHLVMRSSTFKRTGLIQSNGIGIIDNSYCGNTDEWLLPVYAVREGVVRLHQKIAQFRLVKKQDPVQLEQVDSLHSESRGGFGSTDSEQFST